MRRLLLTTIALSLVACPEAPSNLDGGGAPATGGENQQQMTGNTAFDAAPTLDTVIDEPTNTQDELADDDEAVTLSGTIVCESGTGPYRIRIFVPPPSEGGPQAETEGTPPGPLAAITVARAGEFSILTPPGPALKVLAYEDKDDNGVPTPEEAQFGTADGGLTDLSSDTSGLVLNCSNAAPTPDPIPVNTERTPDGAMAPNSEEGAPPDGMPVEGGEEGIPGAPPEGEMLPADGAQGPAPAGLPQGPIEE
jgi:hypothetical protein